MTHGSLFSGIGGFDLAAEWMGWENKFHCEWNEFGQKVLKHQWPDAESFHDITKSDFTKYANRIDILTGGFPCQPYSTAGKRKGKEDDRHLWPEMLRAIREIQPRWVVGENVFGLVNWNGGLVFDEVQADLEVEGYEVQPYLLPAAAVNAPHRRDRVWFVAFKDSNCYGRGSIIGQDESGIGEQWDAGTRNNEWLQTNNGEIRTSSHPDSIRFNGGKCEHEINTGEGRVNAQRDTIKSLDNGDAADTNSIRTNSIRTNKGCQEQQAAKSFKDGIKERISNDANTSDKGLQRGEFNGTPDPEGQNGREQPSGSASKFYQISDWSNFPTQSPICSGNDGIPTGLDGITFSKWRNESIKAAGNAIVPQVVFQIFKAIQEYEQNAN